MVLLTPDDLPSGQTFGVGYDGRFVYHIAVNPLGSVDGLDESNYRYQRVLLPLLVKIFSFGNPTMVPWLMAALNIMALTAGTVLLGRLLQKRHVAIWLALAYPLSIGSLLALRLDLLEPLVLGLALAGLVAYESDRNRLAAVLFILGGLTKEVALIFPLALALGALWERRWQKAALWMSPLIVYMGFYLFLSSVFGVPAASVEKTRLMLFPFSGLWLLEDGPSRIIVLLWAVLPAGFVLLFAGWDILRDGFRGDLSHESLLVFANAALVATLPAPTWVDPLAVLRLALGLVMTCLIWLATRHRGALPLAFGLWIASGLILLPIPGMF